MKLLLTSTSFTDAKGVHQDLLNKQGFDIDVMRGPLFDYELKPIIANYDAVICGDDEYTAEILEIGKAGKLKYISKYGVGLDKIDLKKAKELGIPVTNCPGVNQVSVAEHVYALLLSFVKNIHLEYNITKDGGWKRHVSTEIYGKTLGIVGLGAIGKEVAKRATCFGLNVIAFDKFVSADFINEHPFIKLAENFEEIASKSDIITLHVPHTPETESIINAQIINEKLKKGVIIINTARGKLVNLEDLIKGLDSGTIGGYLADVLDIEPMPENYVLKDKENVLITPHIGSRTYESVQRQGLFAVQNLIKLLKNNE
ncbi:MAG: phosphoglycerate dehydrogenase [Flavobacteriia bacterium]|nr:phosphoglycerate dehydrogenase [Flavobacteriia bacterium]